MDGTVFTPPPPAPPAPPPRAPRPQRSAEPHGFDAWPNTPRVLPWLIASFLVVITLVPFDSMTLTASGGIDIKPDRIVIGLMTVIWIGSFLAGGPGSPRTRGGLTSAPIIALLALSVLSVVINAVTLAQADDLGSATKQLATLFSYGALFGIVVTTVRRDEVSRFANLLLALIVISAIGTLYQYFTHYNVFFAAAGLIPDSIFALKHVGEVRFAGVPVTGPTRHGLALAGMMALALSFGIVRMFRATTVPQVVGNGLVLIILLGGVFSTSRKTALLGAIAGVLMIAMLRPKQALRLAPLALIMLSLAFAIRPAAVEKQLQIINPAALTGDQSAQARKNDYPAIAPELQARPMLGRGYGSYDPKKYRILDNQYLALLATIGLLGTAAFLMTWLVVPFVVFRLQQAALARERTQRSPAGELVLTDIAVACAGSAATFGLAAVLFDVLAFPQVPYLFFFVAGIAGVLASTQPQLATQAVEQFVVQLQGRLRPRARGHSGTRRAPVRRGGAKPQRPVRRGGDRPHAPAPIPAAVPLPPVVPSGDAPAAVPAERRVPAARPVRVPRTRTQRRTRGTEFTRPAAGVVALLLSVMLLTRGGTPPGLQGLGLRPPGSSTDGFDSFGTVKPGGPAQDEGLLGSLADTGEKIVAGSRTLALAPRRVGASPRPVTQDKPAPTRKPAQGPQSPRPSRPTTTPSEPVVLTPVGEQPSAVRPTGETTTPAKPKPEERPQQDAPEGEPSGGQSSPASQPPPPPPPSSSEPEPSSPPPPSSPIPASPIPLPVPVPDVKIPPLIG